MQDAYAYPRVSAKSQLDGDGFDRQRDSMNRYAKAHKVNILQEFPEEAVPGDTELANRPALSAMMDAIVANGVRLVLVERADRLARDLIVSELLLAEFRKMGVRVIAVDSGEDLTAVDADPTKVLIRQILGALAQWEKSVIVLKLQAARQRKRREHGRCEGDKPFGQKPGEEAALNRIKELARKPRGRPRPKATWIAKRLNAEGVPTRSGKPWTRSTIWKVLHRLAS